MVSFRLFLAKSEGMTHTVWGLDAGRGLYSNHRPKKTAPEKYLTSINSIPRVHYTEMTLTFRMDMG